MCVDGKIIFLCKVKLHINKDTWGGILIRPESVKYQNIYFCSIAHETTNRKGVNIRSCLLLLFLFLLIMCACVHVYVYICLSATLA